MCDNEVKKSIKYLRQLKEPIQLHNEKVMIHGNKAITHCAVDNIIGNQPLVKPIEITKVSQDFSKPISDFVSTTT